MYVSLAEFKTWISATDTVDDHHLEPIILAAERFIDRKCGRHFTLENEATKYFYPSTDGRVPVVDLVSVTSLKTDTSGDRSYATTLTTSQYELLPYADESGRPAVRFQEIRIWPTASQNIAAGRLVQIVGDFGYVDEDGQTPADIRLLALILGSRFWKRHETPLGVLGTTDLGTFERISKEDPDAVSIIAQYSRKQSWVVV